MEDGVITVPSFRIDIHHQADISEEIARFYGYNKIPATQLRGSAQAELTPRQKFNRLVEQTMRSCGLSEIQTFSFISPKEYDRIRLPKESGLRKNIVIKNPLGEDTSVMRTTSIPSMLNVLSRNYNNRNERAWLYEMSTVYIPHETLDELPDENQQLVLGLYGKGTDYFVLKGMVEKLLSICGIAEYDVEPVKDDPTFHPGRTASITVDGEEVVRLGEIHPAVLHNYEIGDRAYIAAIDVEKLYEKADLVKIYRHLPKYPVTTRDLAFVVDAATPVLVLEKAIRQAISSSILEKLELFDVYTGDQVGKDKKSVAFSLKFRASDRTLTDEEVDAAVKKAVKSVEKCGGVLRS